MPPEPLPWDRKDFVFRDRRPHDRGPVDALGRAGAPGSFSATRWREPPPFRGGGARDFRAPSPRRPLPGGAHYKQPFLSKQPAAHACPPPPPPPPPPFPDEENFRCYSGRYGSSSSTTGGGREGARREVRGHVQRSPPLNSADTPRRHHDPPLAACAQRSVTVPPQTPPASTSSPSPSPLLPLKDQHDDDKTAAPVPDAPATGGSTTTVSDKDRDQEHSLGPIAWKPLKWTRSGGFSSSTKPAFRSEHDDNGATAVEGSTQQQMGAGNPSSPPQLAASPTPSDEGQARKKQRLGWGQGLAKYEKQKVEGPEESCSGKNTMVQCTTAPLNLKPTASESSPKPLPLPGSASPTTPSSINCSSSKGVDDKFCLRTSSVDIASNLSDSPCHESQCFSSNDFSLDLENLNADSLILMSSMLAYVLQPEDTCSGDSKFTRQTAVNKIAALKSDILKALEKTETEIDNIENDLKASTPEQDEQSKCQSDEDVTPDPVTDIDPTSSCSGPMNDLILQPPPLSTESVQNDLSVKECNGGKEHDIAVVNDDAITEKSEGGIEAAILSNSDLKTDISSASTYDDKDLVWRIPSCLEDDYMCKLIPRITSHNCLLASNASNMLNKDLLTSSSSEAECSAVASALHVKKKIVNHKHSLHAKERALTLKFMLLQHLWKEDMHSLFIKKQRSKSQKRGEFGLRPALNGSQKPRTSRLRLSPQGSSTSGPTREMVDLASRLLSEPGNKMYTKYSSMPCLILDENERRSSKLASNKNGLVEDPVSLEKEKALINPWTDEERKIFLDNLAIHGKDFKKVASFLCHKTTADCIEFYYKNHRSDSFEPVKKILRLRKQERVEQSLLSNNYMVETGKKWKREVTASSLDILGAASAIVSHSTINARVWPKVLGRSIHGGQYVSKTSSDSKSRAKSTECPAEAAAANVLAGICSTISSEGISCVTSSVDPGEKVECPVFSEVTQTIDEETCSDEGFGKPGSGDWTDDEKTLFIRALGIYKRDFGRISQYLGTRSKEQCKIFFSKARKCLGLDVLSQGGGNGGTPSSDANCGKSDLEDACLAEMDSAACSIQSCSKMDIDLAGSTDKVANHGTTQVVDPVHDTVQGNSNEDFDVGPSKEEFECVAEITFRNNDLNLSTENEGASYKKIQEADELLNVPAGGKSFPERVEELKADHSDHFITLIEAVSSVFPITGVSVKHEIIDFQHEDARRNSFDNDDVQVKSEPENLVESVALGSADKVGLPPIGVSTVNSPQLDCNGSVAFSGKNEVCSSVDMLVPCVENQIELNLPPLPAKNTEMVAPRKQLSASTLPMDPLPLVTAIPSLRLESQPVCSLVNLNCEINTSTSHTSCDKDVGEKGKFVLGKQPMDVANQPPKILSGFPLQSFNREKMDGDTGLFVLKSVDMDDMQKKSWDDNIHKPLFRKEMDCDDKRCGKNSSTYDLKPSIIHFPPADALLRPCSQGHCSEAEEPPPPVRTGDVKLFGKILSHPPSVPKPEELEVKPSTSAFISTPANDIKHLSFELTSSRNSSSVLHQTNTDTTHFGLAEQPLRSYGFWDGQRIRTGFSSLPENTMLLSKYPDVLSGMTSYYQNKDSIGHASTSNNCFVIHQQRPFSVDGKGQNGMIEMPKQRNSIEAIPGFQQSGRGAMLVGGNMLAGGGSCTATGISDPVAALQMHYSRQNELLGGVSNSTEDSWKGDVAGR